MAGSWSTPYILGYIYISRINYNAGTTSAPLLLVDRLDCISQTL